MAKRRGLIRKGPFHFANVPRILTAISEEEIEFQIESIFNICLFYLRTRIKIRHQFLAPFFPADNSRSIEKYDERQRVRMARTKFAGVREVSVDQ